MTSRCLRIAIAVVLGLNLGSLAYPQDNISHPQNKPASPQSKAESKALQPVAKVAKAGGVALTERQRVLHALNRLTFGARPGEADAVLAKGLDSWMEDQLHPESIDDSALNARVAPYATTRMSPKQLAQAFPSDGVIRQILTGKRTAPADTPELKLVYAVNIARIQQQDANQAAGASATPNPPNANDGSPPKPSPAEEQARTIADSLLLLPKNQRLAAMENTPPEQLVNFPNLLRGDQRDRLVADFSPAERELFRALANPAGVVASELQQAKVMRAIYSERQLLEVMTDFWFNHFNVFQNKNQDVYYTTAYERDVIRPHAFGKFYDLLLATAQSPAMLMYLDNWLSIGPHSAAAGKNGQSGLNENYGRELLELHTLGVDGGYTQGDVTQLATVLTGWTIAQPDDGGQFQFDPKRHEPGSKVVLGEKFYDAGADEGLHALDILAHHPATAHFICQSIATRFVADDPPESLVQRMAATFQSSDGDIREVLRTMIHSPEFWSPAVYRAKLKTPLEFIVSAVRASGTNVTAPDALVQNLGAMGMPPYGMVPPTGYPTKAAAWDNTGAVLARINFATALSQGKLPGLQFDPAGLLALGILKSPNLSRTEAALAEDHAGLDFAIAVTEDTILQGDLAAKDVTVIRKELQDPEVKRQTEATPLDVLRFAAGYTLASPEFQHH